LRKPTIKISPEIIDPEKPAQLEKFVLQAVSGAMDESKKLADKHLSELTGGIKIPGLTD